MKYEENVWYGWNGGECPVHEESVTDLVCIGGDNIVRLKNMRAGHISWSSDVASKIIAFRVIKEYKEPREFWLWDGQVYKNLKDAEYDCKEWGQKTGKIIHVKEVLE